MLASACTEHLEGVENLGATKQTFEKFLSWTSKLLDGVLLIALHIFFSEDSRHEKYFLLHMFSYLGHVLM